MDTRRIIEHFSQKEDKKNVYSAINETLQNYFTEDIPEELALELIQELNELVKLGESAIRYRHLGDGEYYIDTPFEKIYFKLQALTYIYPEKIFLQEYLDELSKNYSEDVQEFGYSYDRETEDFFKYLPQFESTPEIHAKFMEQYFINNNIPFHPSFSVFQEFEKLVNNLSPNSKDIEHLQNFWIENSKILTTSCANSDVWSIPEIYEEFLTDAEVISNLNKANNLMIIETRAKIAKELFKNFLNHPEMQNQLSERFPLFFKFSSWMKPIDIKGFYCQFEEHHIETLSKYKHRAGYSSYIMNTFGVEIKEYENYGLLLTKIAQKASLYTNLFDHPDDESKLFTNCYCLSDLLKKTMADQFSANKMYHDQKEKRDSFMNFINTLIIESEHSELQNELPTNIGIQDKQIKL